MFKEDCEKVPVPARSPEGVEKEVDEYRGLVSTKPIEEIGISHVMEETKSDSGGSTFVYLCPAVSVAPKATPSTKCECVCVCVCVCVVVCCVHGELFVVTF